MARLKAFLFRRDRLWLTAVVGLLCLLTFAAIIFNKGQSNNADAFSAGDAEFTNNGAAADTVAIGETGLEILDITLPDPVTDGAAIHDGAAASAAGNALTDFGANNRFADDNDDDAQDYADGMLIVLSADATITGGEVVTSGTAGLIEFDGNDAGADDMFYDEDRDNAEDDYSGTELIVRSADTTIADAEIITSGTADLTAFGTADAVGMMIFADTTDDNVFDALDDANTEDIYAFIHNGADDFVGDGTEDLEDFAATEMFYDDNVLGDNGTYDDGEAIVSDNDADGLPTAGDTVITAGEAGVAAFDNADGVYLEDANDDGNYDAGEVIWKDVGDTGVFDAATDFVLVGGAAPTCAPGGPCIEIDNLANESGLAYLDDNAGGTYTGTRNTSAETVIWFGNAVNPTDGDTLATTVTFFDPAQLADDDINGLWLEDLNAFAADQFFIRVGNGAYADGDDIVDLLTDGTDVSGDASEVWDMDANDKFSDTDNDGAYDTGEFIARSADANVAAGETLVTGTMDVNDFDATTTYSDADDGATYTDAELIADAAAAGNVTALNILKSGTVDVTAFDSSTTPFHKFHDANAGATYTDGEDIYADADNNDLISSDRMTGLTVTNTGTAVDADIDALYVYFEDGSTPGFQIGEDTLTMTDTDGTYFGSQELFTGPVYLSGAATTVNQRFYVIVDIDVAGGGDGNPTDGATFIAQLSDASAGGDGDCNTDGELACAVFLQSTTAVAGGADGPTNVNVTNGATQTIDASVPTFTSATTDDTDNDSFVDSIVVVLSEDLADATVDGDGSDFTVTGCDVGAVTRTVTAAAELAGTVTLTLTPDATSDTGVACTVNMASGTDTDTVSDGAGNFVAAGALGATTDGAPPSMIDADTDDNDADGQIDRIVVTYSEDLDGTTVIGADFTLDGGYAVASASETSAGVVTLVVTESGAPDTDATPTVTEAGAVDDASAGTITSEGAETELADDGAGPVIIDVDTLDGYTAASGATGVNPTITAGTVNGILDALEVLYSEPISDATIEANDYTVDGGEVVSSVDSGSVANDETIYVILGDTVWSTGGLPNLTYTDDNAGVDVDDAAAGDNDAPTETDAVDDTAPPAITAAETNDADGDGEVDQLLINFSEGTKVVDGLVGDGFVPLTLACSVGCGGDGNATISNGDYAGTYGPVVTLILTLDEADVPTNNTSVLITPTYDDDAGVLGHSICDDDVADGDCDTDYPAQNQMIDGETFAGTDGADPVFVSAQTTSDNDIEITFSENVQGAAFTDLTTHSGAVNFTAVSSAGPANPITWQNAATAWNTDATGSSTGTGTDSTGVARTTIPNLTMAAGAVTDTSGNNNPLISNSTITTDGAAPILLSSTYRDTNSNGTVETIRTTWSEQVTMAGSTAPDWTIVAGSINAAFSAASDDAVAGTTLDVTITADASETGGAVNPTIAYDNDDANGSVVDVSAATNAAGTNAAVTSTDVAAPVQLSATYEDTDANGTVDRVDIVTSTDAGLTCTFEGGDWSIVTAGTVNVNTPVSCAISGNDIRVGVSADANETGGLVDPTIRYQNLVTAGSVADGAGNQTVDFGAPGLTVTDGAAPATLATTVYQDTNADGAIDTVVIDVSSDVGTALTYEDGDWDVTTAGTITLADETAGVYAANQITLTVTADAGETGGAVDPVVRYQDLVTAGSLTDGAGNNTGTQAETATDDAAPATLSAVYQDTNTNGTIDAVVITVSTDVGTALTYEDGDWDVTTAGTITLADESAAALVGTEITLTVTADAGETGGAVDPVVRYQDLVTAGSLTDGAGNNTGTQSETATDNAAPATLSAVYQDTNTNGTIDAVVINVSTDVGTALTYEDGDWDVTTAGTITLADETAGVYAANQITLTVTADAGETGGAVDPVVRYQDLVTAGSLTDGAGNNTGTQSETATDNAAPATLSAVYQDTNTNGTIDAIVVTISSEIATAFEYEDGDWDVTTAGTITLADETLAVYAANQITLTVTADAGETGGAVDPVVRYQDLGGGSSLNDGVGNITGTQAETATDDAAPIPLSAIYNDNDANGDIDEVEITLSADVGTAMTFDASDWTVTTLGTIGLDTPTAGALAAPVISLTVTADDNETGGATDPIIQYSNDGDANVLTDGAGNNTGTEAVTVDDSAGPVIVSTDPADGGTLRPRSESMIVVFTEEVDGATFDITSAPDPGGFAFAVSGTQVTISHSPYNNAADVTFTINIADDISPAANILAGALVPNPWDFEARNASGGGGGGGGGSGAVASLAVVSPNGGEMLQQGLTHNITWTSSGLTATMRLSLSSDGGLTFPTVITTGEANDGSYVWSIPAVTGSTYRIKVEGLNPDGVVLLTDLSDANFSIGPAGAIPNPTPTTPPTGQDIPGVTSGPSYNVALAMSSSPSINVDKNLPVATGPVNCTSGSLFRSVTISTVYYCGADGKRYVFPSDKVYFTWFADFSGVVFLSDSVVASIPLGGVVTYRPGVRMIKLESDPKVYAIATGGMLRWVTTEALAIKYYGADWNTKIDDISIAFFPRYTTGPDIIE